VEIGGGENSTCGSEPSHAIVREEINNPVNRGYELWFMNEARKRNPYIILDCLLSAYPENALELWRTLDYWEIRTLLALKRESARSPDIKLQELKNEKFNELLDEVADKQLVWRGLEQKKTLRGIKKYSFDFFD
jgi:hypothetical protein